MNSEEIIRLAPIATPVVAALVEAFFKPKFQQWGKEGKAERDAFELVQEKFQKYLESAIFNHGYIKTVVFQNEPKLLVDLYQPLTLEKNSNNAAKMDRTKIESYDEDFVNKHKYILIRDDAGMGKSTLLRFLFLKCIEQGIGLPIFIELRHLRADQSLFEFLREQISPIDSEVNVDAIKEILASGGFILFLDGYDEISEGERSEITKMMQDFISKSSKNTFILSSRDEPSLASFSNFQGFSIKGLNVEEAYELIQKYGKQGGPSEELIGELKKDSSSVQDFLSNPMLVSLLFKAFSYKSSVPLERPAFYNQVFDALFEGHDLTKPLYRRGKRSDLSRDKFEQVLRALGLVTLKKGVGYSKVKLLDNIKKAQSMCSNLEFDPSDFLSDILRTVPLFAVEGDYYRWKHKSLQEYFAARYICIDSKEKQKDILLKMSSGIEHKNVLGLCYDIDYNTFRRSVVYKLVSEFIDFCEEKYPAGRCKGVSVSDFERRLGVMFAHTDIIFPPKFLEENVEGVVGGREFDLMQDYARQNFPSKRVVSVGRLMPGGILRMENKNAEIIRFLGEKRDTCVTYFEEKGAIIWDEDGLLSDGTLVTNPIVINDDCESWVNNQKYFDKVTNFIAYNTIEIARFFLSVRNCRALKKEIEAEIRGMKNGDTLLSFI